jgi:drug/metabolite transporter (DMT)-like permease
VASFAWAAGAAMQKHGLATRFPKVSLRTFLRQFGAIARTMGANWLWVGGIAISLLGGLFFVQAVSMGDLSVITPLVNMTMVFAVLLGVVLLRERMDPAEWAGMALMIAGAVVISLSGAEETAVPPSGRALYGFAAGIAGLTALAFAVQKAMPRRVPVEVALAVGAGLIFGLGNITVKVLTFLAETRLGAFDLLAWATWKVVLASLPALLLLACEIVAFVMMQGAFAHGRVSLVSPITTIVSVLVPIAAGVTIFREAVPPSRLTGIVVTVVGTGVLALRKAGAEAAPGAAPETAE